MLATRRRCPHERRKVIERIGRGNERYKKKHGITMAEAIARKMGKRCPVYAQSDVA
jgi:hypothetical protein